MKKPPISGPATDETPKTAPKRPDVAAALARRDDVADRRLRADHQPAAAQPLDRAERDQLGHPLREPAQRGADQEEHERALQHDLAPVEVAELAVERRDDRDRQQVGGDHPRDVLQPAEVADDRRQRGRDDRLVERREQHHQHQRAEDHPEAPRRPSAACSTAVTPAIVPSGRCEVARGGVRVDRPSSEARSTE